jgi:hypothetical protein
VQRGAVITLLAESRRRGQRFLFAIRSFHRFLKIARVNKYVDLHSRPATLHGVDFNIYLPLPPAFTGAGGLPQSGSKRVGWVSEA